MKTRTILLLVFAFAWLQNTKAQAPHLINYQAVARNADGTVLPNHALDIRFTVHDGSELGAVVYQETDTATTNMFGLFTIMVGGGIVNSGGFDSIYWSAGNKYLQVELDTSGVGNAFTTMGNTELLSVPYALYANASGTNAALNAWGLTGNTGTSALINFIGTNASTDLEFKI